MISLEKWYILTPLQKMPKNEGDLGKFFVSKGFKKLPKVKKSPILVTLSTSDIFHIFTIRNWCNLCGFRSRILGI